MTIKIYSTPACKYCNLEKAFLKAHGFEYEEIDLTKDEVAKNYIKEKTGKTAVPVTDLNGEFIVGFGEDLFRSKLGMPAR